MKKSGVFVFVFILCSFLAFAENETVDCESIEELQERLYCKFEQTNMSLSTFEQCQFFSDPLDCVFLINESVACQDADDKNTCLRLISASHRFDGIDSIIVDRSSKQEQKNYLTLLLHDLESRVLKAHNQSEIPVYGSVALMTQIIFLTQDILVEKEKSEIEAQFTRLQDSWQIYFG